MNSYKTVDYMYGIKLTHINIDLTIETFLNRKL